MAIALLLCVLAEAQAQAERGIIIAETGVAGVKLTLSQLDIDVNELTLGYEVKNGSTHDIWLCAAIDWTHDFEVCFAEEDQTLTIRRRLDVPTSAGFYEPPEGMYVRLPRGESRAESLRLALPIRDSPLFCSMDLPLGKTVYASKLAVELGFYDHDVAAMILSMLDKAEKVPRPVRDRGILFWLRGSLGFATSNERIRDRDQEVQFTYNEQSLEPEQVLGVVVENLKIPYAGPHSPQTWVAPAKPPGLTNCTRVTVTYQPSMLEYFYPSASQQSLLSPEERESLQRQKTIVVDDPEQIKALRNDISHGRAAGIAVTGSTANVVCYHDANSLASFTVYGGQRLVTEDGLRFKYVDCIESLRTLAAPAKGFELRSRCAANLKNLWYRLRLYYRFRNPPAAPRYPPTVKWCDHIVAAYRKKVASQQQLLNAFRCPTADEGKSHYAVNPGCAYASPPDVVLLFETKAGWNQYGGLESFTFDNHDPKGGLVVLNDGTVKFIRTEEELKQLRWK